MPALQLSGTYTSTQTGATTSTGYARVNRFSGNEVHFNFDVNIWVSEDAFNSSLAPFDNRNYSVPTAEVTGTAPLYDFLVSLPEFTGSTIVS